MLRKTSILFQLILGFSVILIVILTITSFFSYRYSSKVVVEKTSSYLLDSVVQMRGKTDVMLQEYDRLAQKVAFSPEIQQHFNAVSRGGETTSTIADINKFIADQSRYSGSDLTIHMLDASGDLYSRNDALAFFWRSEDELRRVEWFPSVAEMHGRMLWLSAPAWRSGTIQAIIGARQLNDWSSLERIGDMFLLISVDTIRRVIDENARGLSRKTHVIDSRGKIVYSTETEEIGENVNSELFARMKTRDTDLINWDMNDAAAYVPYSTSAYSGWTVASYIDAKDMVNDLENIQKSILVIGLFGIGAAILLTIFFSWSVSKPIRYLAHRLSRVERGMLNPSRGRLINQEVSILFDSYNSMVSSLNDTIRDLSGKQATEKQAQIIALKAQFRPHFLYNSLNTIYWQLINDGQDKTAQMVLTLSDLMRYSIQPGSELVTIREDLEQLNRYLLLQQARYGDKLQVTIDADESLLRHRVMKMLLQPLVENSITHGLETVKGRPWRINIEIRQTDDHILLSVEDNGKGMPQAEMRTVLEEHSGSAEPDSMHTGLGLANLQRRISLIYGKDYGITLREGMEGGLRVEIDLPADGARGTGNEQR
ncbi:sensor histidine kinase [Paenibacillus abyssi]|uniref:histidine kinase n=1 Tax=Paenibacillus abyssi TaxID=1340531 RepID=A0A917D1T1_9BACL|nr:sensor histidine kinase [Paenibacillus abyssi]GGG07960.1 sensor histidine kinase YesM [Paenibacillus abyssi]